MSREEIENQFVEILENNLLVRERRDVVFIHFDGEKLEERVEKGDGFVYELQPNNLIFYGELNIQGWGPRKIKNFIPNFLLMEFPKIWKNLNTLITNS